jgi:ABC-type transporter Mla subunit MlaD
MTASMSVRGLIGLPGLPARLESDLEEIKDLIRALLDTEDTLVQTTRATNEQASQLNTVVGQLAVAIEQLGGLNDSLNRVDGRLEAMQHDIRRVAHAVDDVAEHLPRKNQGAIAKAKDALTGEP